MAEPRNVSEGRRLPSRARPMPGNTPGTVADRDDFARIRHDGIGVQAVPSTRSRRSRSSRRRAALSKK
ncbi:MAG: hypothetical protein K8L99_13105 [Anaerolineae bacterium]|nr:hypothetical protein [Anaerolineae bacterium]